ncbi:MAG: inorganic phosphate transporter [Bacteroidetes bacterium]|nr:inorganic phosphate transporter [Bacteroidota bacterium]
MFDLSTGLFILLIVCVALTIFFEFINGFHDTANAVATVIYTNALKPTVAVVFSGICNFVGVFVGGLGVAMGIVNILPTEVLVDANIYHSISMILAVLITAIIWNFGTWYVGLPASSSHTLIGSILGIGIALSIADGKNSVNWTKAQDIGLALLLSPLFGFAVAIFVMYLFKRLIRNQYIYKEPIPGKTPPTWIRWVLTTCCGLVSFTHGSNDGQKGIGLLMLVLIVFVPKSFVINPDIKLAELNTVNTEISKYINIADSSRIVNKPDIKWYREIKKATLNISELISSQHSVDSMPTADKAALRKDIIVIGKNFEKLIAGKNIALSLNEINEVKHLISKLKNTTDFAPNWVKIAISIALGLGTMVGWRRIVETVGSKIGKQSMSYAQGTAAQLVGSSTIALSTGFGLPVSTTHVLSSAIAGTMVAKKGLKNLQKKTIKNILLAWVLTLPVTIIMSGLLFLLFRKIM